MVSKAQLMALVAGDSWLERGSSAAGSGLTALAVLRYDFAPLGRDHENASPDITTFAEEPTSGCAPMGALTISGAIDGAMASYAPDGVPSGHGLTHSGHPVSAAVALAVLEICEAGIFGNAARPDLECSEAPGPLRLPANSQASHTKTDAPTDDEKGPVHRTGPRSRQSPAITRDCRRAGAGT